MEKTETVETVPGVSELRWNRAEAAVENDTESKLAHHQNLFHVWSFAF